MRLPARIAIMCVPCLLVPESVSAQRAVHGGDGLGAEDSLAAAALRPTDRGARSHHLSIPTVKPADTGSVGRCVDTPVDVTATSADERRFICSAANHALRLLGRCNIYLQTPLLVQITNEVLHPFSGVVLGLFDARLERVRVTRAETIPYLIRGTPFGALRPRDFYRSLIVHEVVHAVMHQNFVNHPTSRSAHEYPAYALQLASLPAGERAKYLDSVDRDGGGEFLFNDLVLSLDSFVFAARAYRHYESASNGCARLHAILAGREDFIATIPSL